ncbi:MAG TPA: hypothetical protein ENG67_02540 [candidate division WOR-3 bacterium]|uniref:Uncharacterized protein n=1 Tax=candidate division WOR-3 bacterium TaxID=2052148 RepID=A0A7C1BFS7_UNCW3|nr:hypothetical protein [candidate division WOR-3 bacterium]
MPRKAMVMTVGTGNYSILAYGFDPLDERKAGAFMEYLERQVMPEFVKDFEKLSGEVTFPQIEVRP